MTPEPHFGRVCIIGVGLLGSSLGLALKSRGLAGRVVGVGHRQSSLDTAIAHGAIDEAFLEIAPAVKDADLIVIATPANMVIPKLEMCLDNGSSKTTICDVASTKAEICAWAAEHCPKPRRFVGCHPMAGSEKFGAEHGDANLFVARPCIVENSDDISSDAREVVKGLWELVGAKVVEMAPVKHDQVLARTSHIPHILATAIATLAERHGAGGDVIGNGFRDMTRVAAGRPEMWRDIVLTNAAAIHQGIGELQEYLKEFAEAVDAKDAAALERLFEAGRVARTKVVDT